MSTRQRGIDADIYGTLSFGNGRPASWMRVNGTENDPKRFWSIASTAWELDKPKMIISVIGSGASLKLSPKVRENFGRGLVNAVLSTQAWVITSGIDVGISKEVGDAVRKYAVGKADDIKLIGVVGWKTLDQTNRSNMENGHGQKCFYSPVKDDKYNSVDKRHSYQVFVDHGEEGQSGKELSYRTAIEDYLRNNPSKDANIFDSPEYKVPTVCIVVQGGWHALKKAYKSVTEGIPVILLKDSGGFSDVISDALDLDIDQVTPAKLIELMEENDLGTKTNNIEDIKKWTRWLVSMLQYNKMCDGKYINVFSLTGSNEYYVDTAILRSLLQLETELPMQTYIAMCWNRYDIAREKLQLTDKIDLLTESERRILFKTGILMDRVKFLEILFEFDIINKPFLETLKSSDNYRVLLEAFYTKLPKTESPFYKLYQDHIGTDKISIDNLGRFENHILKIGEYQSCYLSEQTVILGIEPFNVIRDLFLWSLYLGKLEMTEIMFSQQDQGLSSALVAIRLLKRFSEHSDSETQKELLLEYAGKYEKLAKGILDKCFEYSKYDVIRLLLRKVSEWGNVTMINLAIAAGSRLLKTHPAIQMVTSCAWQGGLSSSTTWVQVYATLFCPLLLFLENFVEFNYSEEIQVGDMQSVMLTSVIAELNAMKDESKNMNKNSMKKSTRDSVKVEMDKNGGKFAGSKFALEHDDIGDADDLLIEEDSEEFDDDDMFTTPIKTAPLSWRFWLFYSSPQVIFTTHTISFFVFLVVFGYILLFDYNVRPSILEWCLLFWVFTFICEEIRQIVEINETSSKKQTRLRKIMTGLRGWVGDSWNWFDAAGIITFMIGFFVRFAIKDSLDECDPYVVYQNCRTNATLCDVECDGQEVNRKMYCSHAVYCISFILYSIRLLHVFQMSKHLGPKLIMIRKMTADILYLMAVLSVFMLWYGIVSQALLYPNHDSMAFQIRRMIRRSYFHMYGELFLEEVANIPDVSEFECTNNPRETLEDNIPRCPIPDVGDHFPFVPLFTAIYMMVVNVLLLNLLIAMFSRTYEKVEAEAEDVANLLQYELIHEYYFRPVMPPPFIFFAHIARVSRALCCQKNVAETTETKSTKTYFSQGTSLLTELEKWGTGVYLNEVKKEEKRSIRNVLDDLARQAETNKAFSLARVSEVHQSQAAFQFMMDQHFRQVTETLKWMSQAMVQNNITVSEGDDAGPPPNIQIPLNIRQIINDENNKYQMHILARLPNYRRHDGQKVRRYPVPDARVPFLVAYESYQPNHYTAPVSTEDDPDLAAPNLTKEEMADFENPVGRTGLTGRGVLEQWGDNKQLVILIWRWLKDQNGENVTKGGQEMIQVLGIRKTKYLHWQLPKVFSDDDIDVDYQVRTLFYEQCVGRGAMHESIRENFNWLFSKDSGNYDTIFHDGYIDDHKNTDNAWISALVYSFEINFDVDFESTERGINDQINCSLQGSHYGLPTWITITDGVNIYEPHKKLIEELTDSQCAHFTTSL